MQFFHYYFLHSSQCLCDPGAIWQQSIRPLYKSIPLDLGDSILTSMTSEAVGGHSTLFLTYNLTSLWCPFMQANINVILPLLLLAFKSMFLSKWSKSILTTFVWMNVARFARTIVQSVVLFIRLLDNYSKQTFSFQLEAISRYDLLSL